MQTIDYTSETWLIISARLETECKRIEKKLLSINLGFSETQYYRGYHAALTALLNEPERLQQQALRKNKEQ